MLTVSHFQKIQSLKIAIEDLNLRPNPGLNEETDYKMLF